MMHTTAPGPPFDLDNVVGLAVIDESVLHREIGGPVVLSEQLDHLLAAATRTNVSIRVLPYSAGVHPALHGPFILLDFPIARDPVVVYLEDRIGDDTEMTSPTSTSTPRLPRHC